jgi:hypothetical protein
MPYKYDVFISYQRERFGEWVREYFSKFLDLYLEDALGRKPKIFIDKQIETGDIWPRNLVDALACSRCLVCVWSPSYFDSIWCRYELLTMLERMRKTGNKRKLLLPVVISDGDNFPDYTKPFQWLDCRDYAFTGKGFEDSADYFHLQRLIRDAAKDIRGAIQQAPRWRRTWLDGHVFELPVAPTPAVPQPFIG